jgi:putative FmdB family regulatory protein
MPLYEYRCEACGAEEEALESFSAPSEHACSKCGSPLGMRRQLSRTAFVLSGGGWYATGYGQEPQPGSAKTGTAAAGTAGPDKVPAKPDATAGAAPGDSAAAPSASSGGCAGGCSCH